MFTPTSLVNASTLVRDNRREGPGVERLALVRVKKKLHPLRHHGLHRGCDVEPTAEWTVRLGASCPMRGDGFSACAVPQRAVRLLPSITAFAARKTRPHRVILRDAVAGWIPHNHAV